MADSTIDETVFRELEVAAGAEFVSDLLQTFQAEAPLLLAQINDAHAKQDADRFRRAAHTLKSNAATFGAVALTQRARDFEVGGLASANAEVLAGLDAEYVRAAAALSALKKA